MSKKLGIDLYLHKLQTIASAGYGIGLNIRFAAPAMTFRTYPREWIEIYNNNGYMFSDPMISWGFAQLGTCRWSEMDVPDPQNVMVQARAHGMNYGIVISYGSIATRSLAGLAKAEREFTDVEIFECQRIIERLHNETAPPEQMTYAQIEALQLVAAGGRHSEVAAQIGISESALKARLKSARERLLARTTAEAIQRASEYNLL